MSPSHNNKTNVKRFGFHTPNGYVKGAILKQHSTELTTLVLSYGRCSLRTKIGVVEDNAVHVANIYECNVKLTYRDFDDLYNNALHVSTRQDVIALLEKVYRITNDVNLYNIITQVELIDCNKGECKLWSWHGLYYFEGGKVVEEYEVYDNTAPPITDPSIIIVSFSYLNLHEKNGVIGLSNRMNFDKHEHDLLLSHRVDELVKVDIRTIGSIRSRIRKVEDYDDFMSLLLDIERMKEGVYPYSNP